MNVLRPSLLPGLLESLRHNVSRKINDIALFELGRVFNVSANTPSPVKPGVAAASSSVEERRLAIALTGQRDPVFWTGDARGARFDVYDLKGILESFLEQFGLRGITYTSAADGGPLFLEAAVVQLGKFQLGRFGQLSPLLARQYDLREPVLLAELNFDILLARRNTSKSFKSLPAFPPIRRDVALVVAENTTHEAVLQVVKQAKPANLESVELFDVFRGNNVAQGTKSMAYAFIYRSPERTLTDAEVAAVHEKLVEQFKQKLSAVVRE
jgi:phenylalanyl-tRNA synthetase beta chain